MNTETVTDPRKIMNVPSQHWNGERMKAMFQAANNSKLRYPLLIMTLLLLAAVAITARQLAEGILAEMQGVVYLFPF
jgi:hypothetical protein